MMISNAPSPPPTSDTRDRSCGATIRSRPCWAPRWIASMMETSSWRLKVHSVTRLHHHTKNAARFQNLSTPGLLVTHWPGDLVPLLSGKCWNRSAYHSIPWHATAPLPNLALIKCWDSPSPNSSCRCLPPNVQSANGMLFVTLLPCSSWILFARHWGCANRPSLWKKTSRCRDRKVPPFAHALHPNPTHSCCYVNNSKQHSFYASEKPSCLQLYFLAHASKIHIAV